ncbi:MAG TPA: electron transport complex subunit E [Leucothrix mucor]|uniref:Ion-translocating oxidoreductase complex subunit E n=1 Tax=Leucothrix mucor TaxID=45248 RepID=A0A7V2T4E1_LEUMU|nr:electron transport complex subunit E [Leucothrix mucor]
MSDSQEKQSPAVDYLQLTKDGLWSNNPGLVQLLGLCPLLAVTNNVVNGIGLGIATLVTLVISNASISFSRHWVRKEIRIPFYVLVIASNVTVIDLLMNAWLPQLHLVLGIFIPLIVTNCAIIGRAEAYASRNNIFPAIIDGIMMGIGFMLVLVVLAALREIIGSGTLFINADVMFGESAKNLTITIFDDYKGFLLAILPPGAFLGMGFLIAFKNVIDKRLEKRKGNSVSAIPVVVE